MNGVFKSAWNRIARCFLAGVFAVLPLVITVAVVAWVADFLQRFIGPGTVLGEQLKSLGAWFGFTANQAAAYIIGWIAVLGVLFGLGVLLEMGARKLLQRLVDAVLDRIPLIGSIYNTSKQVVGMLDKKDDDALQGMSAVFCFFGKENGAGILALLVSPERFKINDREYNIVIVPTAPIPFGGGLFFVPVDSVLKTDLAVEGLMSIYVSMGVTAPQFLPKPQGKSEQSDSE